MPQPKVPMIHALALPLETRPRDFAARLGRSRARTLGMRMRRRHLGRRALVLLAAIAVPALAAPDQWASFSIGNAGSSTITVEPMPFEKSGESFPGSAFYYLAPEEPLPQLGDGITSDAGPATDPIAGAIARALRVDNSGIDRTRALECLTAAIYFEAASESDQGQRAVAQVVLNRVAHPSYPNTVCGVVYQGSERVTGCQFSFTCDGALARKPGRMFWLRAMDTARAALSGYVERSVGLATHYHTIAIHPYWAPSLTHITTIGAHRFYRFNGAAGQPGAFRFAYGGGEPLPAPHPRSAAADKQPDPTLDPLAVQKAYEAGLKSAQGGALTPAAGSGLTPARPAPAPAYSAEVQSRGGDAIYRGEKLPENNQVRPEYQNSGRWISQPGT
ncbi:cell wall hydrolase [Novosphingobium sp.]|uniref:cell wall hydrolase n=1 Tax=Novosphingobium sp. TaxID=1874826 RepID=UPI002736D65F|nr:cell wall hydrolase [Novosphingobium sp.]MDP3907441.1 cell wall hydrolase [Novosphingobium sp.]